MKRLKTILASDAGYFIHPAIVVVLALLSLNHLLAVLLLCAELLWMWTRLRRLFVVSLAVTALAFAALFFRSFGSDLGQATVFSGTVIDIEADTFLLKSGNRSILVYHEGEILLSPGDEVTVTGEVFAQTGYRIEHRFDYGAYLRAEGIDGTFYADGIVRTGHHFQWNVIKTEVTGYLLSAFPETSAGMIVYVLLGNDTYLASGVTDAVQTLGISHLFAISGMNIAMIVGFLDAILKKLFLQKRMKEGIIIVLLGIYTLLTGFSVSVVRAVLIVLCVYIKEWGKLPFSKLDLMSFTLMGSLLFNPFLIRSLSFQLSFLIAFAIVIGKDLLKTESPLFSVLKIGLYANLIALPILLEVNKEFNLLSIPSNLFFVLFVEKILFPATFLTVAIPPFAPYYGILVRWFSGGVAFLAGFDAAIPFNFPSDLSKILYSALILVLLVRIEKKRRWGNTAAALMALIVFILFLPAVSGVSVVKIFDVGQGDAIYIHEGACDILIDTGDKDDFDTLVSYFKGENIHTLDKVILTHDHADHVGELADLLGQIHVEEIVAGKGLGFASASPVAIVSEGDTITCGTLAFSVLSADRGAADENDNSLVLSGRIGFQTWLFMGDAGLEVEREILENHPVAADVLKIGHHGSDTATGTAFLSAVKPRTAVISVGVGNDYGHPCAATIDKLTAYGGDLFRTDQRGTLTFTYFRLFKIGIVTGDDRDDPFNNAITRFIRFF